MRKVLHPIFMEFHVDSVVAGIPVVHMRFIHAQSLFGRFQIQKVGNVGEVVTEGRFLALFTNVVGVQTCRLIGRCQCQVANDKGSLTGKAVNGAVPLVALVNQGHALGHGRLHGFIDAFVYHLDSMRIVPYHFGVPLVLLFGVRQPVTDGESSQVEIDALVAGRLVALPNTVGDRRHVMSSVRFSNNIERRLGIFGVVLEEGLEKEVGVFRDHGLSRVVLVTVTKSNSRRLIQPQHMRRLCPTVWIDCC
mmetsp:Transcript_10718/g.18884  ORF Transcript_10718/g.18884 Transcript_10718/m.18884 type:complete len:249 (-) Transcript_10718:84-830(-)